MSTEAIIGLLGVAVSLAVAIASLVISVRSARATAASHERDVERELEDRAAMAHAVAAHRYRRVAGREEMFGNGVRVHNNTGVPLRELEIDAVMNGRACTYRAAVCPPGVYFVEWVGYRDPARPWALMSDASDDDEIGYRPYSVSPNWTVVGYRFVDPRRHRWSWSVNDGLALVS